MQSFSLLNQYHKHLEEHNFSEDPLQIQVITYLQNLHARFDSKSSPWWHFFSKRTFSKQQRGIYLWGSVGCGKTFLLSLFFKHLPIKEKKYLHFHAFMNEIHNMLYELKGKTNPLSIIASAWAKKVRLLYLDELYVSDIGDAMILSELFKYIFEQNVVCIISSNCKPENLYLNGLQRERFLPTIALFNHHLQVVQMDSDYDYRLHMLKQEGLYNLLADKNAEVTMKHTFLQLAMGDLQWNTDLTVNKRSIKTLGSSDAVVWFDFKHICGGAYSSKDYLELALCYQTVLVSNIPIFDNMDDVARRFINMIDSFYDKGVILICSAAAMPHQLYQQAKLANDFQRTVSRLTEMHSESYLAKGHNLNNEKTN